MKYLTVFLAGVVVGWFLDVVLADSGQISGLDS